MGGKFEHIQTLPEDLYVMRTSNVSDSEYGSAVCAVREVVALAQARIAVHDFGVWRQRDYFQNGQLMPHGSVDWYIKIGDNPQRRQVNVWPVLSAILKDPNQAQTRHFDVLITGNDLYLGNTNFVVGAALATATIISVVRFRGFGVLTQECIKQETYHEIGHLFGLPNQNRSGLVKSLGGHCPNECAMQQGLAVPRDWINRANARAESRRVFCGTCANDLQVRSRLPRASILRSG
ncbi:MAG: hypothetical protein NT157_00410 [Candidatus Micrarchaeota archaeon]|nr:hypothetical protein [Candidatus Micrarchaeota archaeon]